MTEHRLARRGKLRTLILPATPDLRALRAAEDRTTPERPTIAALIVRYLQWKAGTAAKHTIRTYTDALRLFSLFLAMSGIDPFAEDADALPASILVAYIIWLRQRPSQRSGRRLEQTTIAVYYSAALDLFRYAVRRHLVPEERFQWGEMAANAAEALGKVRRRLGRHDRRVPLLVAFVDNLPLPDASARGGISRLELLRDRALLHMLLSSGMRREEILSLNRTDVEDGWAATALIIGKGSKARTVFWDTDAQHALKRYLAARTDAHPPVFIRLDNHRGDAGPHGEHWRMGGQTAWEIVKRYSDRAGIPATPHMFRHAMASAMLNKGAPIELIQDLLGHAQITTTKAVYAVYEQRTLRKGFDEYNPTASEQVAELEAEQERRRAGN